MQVKECVRHSLSVDRLEVLRRGPVKGRPISRSGGTAAGAHRESRGDDALAFPAGRGRLHAYDELLVQTTVEGRPLRASHLEARQASVDAVVVP